MISAIAFDGFLWLVISLGPFLFVQRWLHRELQALLLLITRRQDLSLGLFSLFFFPGVLLHEVEPLCDGARARCEDRPLFPAA